MLSDPFIFTIQHTFLLPLYDVSVLRGRGGKAQQLIHHPANAPNGMGLLPEDENNPAWSHNRDNILMPKSSAIHSVIEWSTHRLPKVSQTSLFRGKTLTKPLTQPETLQLPNTLRVTFVLHCLGKALGQNTDLTLPCYSAQAIRNLTGCQDIWGQTPAFCLCFWLHLLLLTFRMWDHLFVCLYVGL